MKVISSVTGRMPIHKNWYETELIYEIDADNFVLSSHRLYRQGVDINDKTSILFPKQVLWQQPWIGTSNSPINDNEILMGIDLANRQADMIFANSDWKIDEK